jgi:metal-responsive CopG/Arc/MetJ family transcriptional regulator
MVEHVYQMNIRISENMLTALDKTLDRSIGENRTTAVRKALKNYITEKGIEIESVQENEKI